MRIGIPALCAAIVLTPVLAAAEPARSNVIERLWQQVETDAGACGTCRIRIAGKAGSLDVLATNGWAAVTHPLREAAAKGHGSWSTQNRGWVSGRPFGVTFRLIDQRLHMTMVVDLADGSQRSVNAVFERIWFGA